VTWRLWANNDSYYVVGREMRGSMKLSVHPPGEKGPDRAFFYGFQRGWLEENPVGMMPPDHPPLMRYYPAERGPGVTRFATIRTPRSVLDRNLQIHHPQATIEWFDPPAEGSAVDMHLFLVEDRDEAAAWCRANFPRGSIHCSTGLCFWNSLLLQRRAVVDPRSALRRALGLTQRFRQLKDNSGRKERTDRSLSVAQGRALDC
jgi:hypothetical protein